jgi:hypothetical protein
MSITNRGATCACMQMWSEKIYGSWKYKQWHHISYNFVSLTNILYHCQ